MLLVERNGAARATVTVGFDTRLPATRSAALALAFLRSALDGRGFTVLDVRVRVAVFG